VESWGKTGGTRVARLSVVRFVGHGHSSSRFRSQNEDRLFASDELGLYLVGGGPTRHAAALSIATVRRFYERVAASRQPPPPEAFIRGRLGLALRIAQRELRSHTPMESPLAVLRIVDDAAYVGQLGNGCVFRMRHGRIERITRDRSYAGALQAMGHHRSRSFSRGSRNDGSRLDIRVEPIEHGDAFVLCTGGLPIAVPDERIASLVEALPADFACAALVGEALRRGSLDDVTTLVVVPA
jgi:serine/threonine protein phosphatase PrpC